MVSAHVYPILRPDAAKQRGDTAADGVGGTEEVFLTNSLGTNGNPQLVLT